MRNVRCWLVVLGLWSALALSIAACTDDPPAKSGGDKAAADAASLCKQGGATLNAATNECLCPEAQTWNGTGCVAVGTPTAAAEGVPPGANDGAEKSIAAESTPALMPAPAAAPVPAPATKAAADERLVKVCALAHARWLADDGYCLCPDRKVLVGSTCRKLAGRMIDDVCLRAVHKGTWHDGGCDCPGETVFNVARGGCVPPVLADQSTLKASCESTLNNGRWEASNVRCLCPKGRVWVDELCQVQQLLASQDICEGAFNKGKWDLAKKRCLCPGGSVWLNQACQSPKSIPPKQICESEANGGRWNSGKRVCVCPRGTSWHGATLTCGVGHLR